MIEFGGKTLRAQVDPDRGGCMTRLDTADGRNVLRPATADFATTGDPTHAAGFVTAPYFGPVTGGGLRWSGRVWPILHNHPDEPEPIHGDAWLRPWSVVAEGPDEVTLAYTHVPMPGLFPAQFRVMQTLRVTGMTFSVSLCLESLADAPIPVGLAWHPYFPRRPGTLLALCATGVWDRSPVTSNVPVGPIPPAMCFDSGRDTRTIDVDDTREGWARTATLTQTEDGLTVTLSASASLGKLQLFSPKRADFLCIEPTSNVPDAHRLAEAGVAGHGLVDLSSGESLSGDVEIAVALHH